MSKERPFPGLITPESLQAGQEFTDRDPQYPASRITTNYRGEGKLQSDMQAAPLGEPPVDVDVRSVYDVRPIQAFDFNVTISGVITSGSETTPAVVNAFNVPTGYVAVVRAYNHCTDPIFPAVTRHDLLMTLQSNNADVPNNIDIPVGPDSQDLVRCFFIVDEGGTFGARFLSSIAVATPYNVFVTVYGNFIRKTGRAANLEIGNPVRTGKPLSPDDQPVTWLRRIASAMGVK